MFKDIQTAHPMLRSFGYGQVDKLEEMLIANGGTAGESTPEKMPFLWLSPINTTINKGVITYNLELLIGDLVREAEQNETDVESDALSICIDVLSKLRNNLEIAANSKVVLDMGTANTVPFYEAYESSYAGQRLTFNIQTMIDFNYCEIPK